MSDRTDERIAAALDRIGRMLGALYAERLSELEQPDVTRRLSRCGFNNKEIADILGITPNAVNVALYKARKAKPPEKSKRSKK